MGHVPDLKVGRRDILRMLAIGTATAAANAPIPAEGKDFPDKRRAHYRADAPDVQTYYRVNRYPEK
jgi:hypothetical protein